MKYKLVLASLLFLLFISASNAQASAGFTSIGASTTTTFSDTTCPNQSTCYYQVTSIDPAGFESAPASCASSQLCIGGNTAVAVMPSSGTHTVALSWTASTTVGATYKIYRHIGPLSATGLSATVN